MSERPSPDVEKEDHDRDEPEPPPLPPENDKFRDYEIDRRRNVVERVIQQES